MIGGEKGLPTLAAARLPQQEHLAEAESGHVRSEAAVEVRAEIVRTLHDGRLWDPKLTFPLHPLPGWRSRSSSK